MDFSYTIIDDVATIYPANLLEPSVRIRFVKPFPLYSGFLILRFHTAFVSGRLEYFLLSSYVGTLTRKYSLSTMRMVEAEALANSAR